MEAHFSSFLLSPSLVNSVGLMVGKKVLSVTKRIFEVPFTFAHVGDHRGDEKS